MYPTPSLLEEGQDTIRTTTTNVATYTTRDLSILDFFLPNSRLGRKYCILSLHLMVFLVAFCYVFRHLLMPRSYSELEMMLRHHNSCYFPVERRHWSWNRASQQAKQQLPDCRYEMQTPIQMQITAENNNPLQECNHISLMTNSTRGSRLSVKVSVPSGKG